MQFQTPTGLWSPNAAEGGGAVRGRPGGGGGGHLFTQHTYLKLVSDTLTNLRYVSLGKLSLNFFVPLQAEIPAARFGGGGGGGGCFRVVYPFSGGFWRQFSSRQWPGLMWQPEALKGAGWQQISAQAPPPPPPRENLSLRTSLPGQQYDRRASPMTLHPEPTTIMICCSATPAQGKENNLKIVPANQQLVSLNGKQKVPHCPHCPRYGTVGNCCDTYQTCH